MTQDILTLALATYGAMKGVVSPMERTERCANRLVRAAALALD